MQQVLKLKIREDIVKRRQEIKQLIHDKSEKYYENLYGLLVELLAIERKLNSRYTIRSLAADNYLNEQYVYQILTWRKATVYTKEQVKKGNLTIRQATRTIRKIGLTSPTRQNEAIKSVVQHQMKNEEIDRHITKHTTNTHELTRERTYKNQWNITRDILRYCSKFNRSLLAVDNIPQNDVSKVLKVLRTHKKLVDSAVKRLDKSVGTTDNETS